jgi:GT2 family glycosyltransferase
MSGPSVSVAVLAYNRREALATTLETVLGRLDAPEGGLEVIVVDNASTDGTAGMVRERFPEVRLIETPANEGIAGWNRAFAAARGDWVLVLDDDCWLAGDGLVRALAAARRHDADLVSFHVASSEDERGFTDAYPTGLLTFWGCAALVRRQVLEELGGFDGRLFIWAHELEFTMRLLDRGYRHLHAPDITAVHMKGLPQVTPANHRRNLRNWGYIAAKLLRGPDAAAALASLAVRTFVEAAGVDRAHLGGFPAVLAGARDGLRVRRPVRRRVSRLYRRNYVEFTSQVRLGARAATARRGAPPPRERFWRERPRLYPRTATAAVRVPR